MASKLQFEIVADAVDIEDLWRAMTKDKIEVIRKAAPELLTEAEILEGDGIGLGSLIWVSFGPDAAGVESFKERIVEFDETKHVLSFLGIEGGFMKLGFTHYVVSFKLDRIGDGKTSINTSITYDLKQNLDETKLLEDFLRVLRHYINSVVRFLQKIKLDQVCGEAMHVF